MNTQSRHHKKDIQASQKEKNYHLDTIRQKHWTVIRIYKHHKECIADHKIVKIIPDHKNAQLCQNDDENPDTNRHEVNL